MKTPADKQQFAIFVPYNLFTEMEKIKQLQKEFSSFLETCNYMGTPSELYAPIAYTILQKGKRLRPMLCLLANDMFGGNVEDALWPALALETFHNYTLIHDDIMDNAPIRRGMPTVCRKWGDNAAILSGDAMHAMAFEFALKTKKSAETVQLLCTVDREVCEGQQYDMEFESRKEVSIEEYLEMIRLKTAVLLATSAKMGAMIAGADAENLTKIYDFGINLGMSFQLQDDILDLYSNVETFGKCHGGDIADNKKTYLYLKAMELSDAKDKKRLQWLFSMKIDHDLEEKIAEVQSIYDKLNVKKATEDLISNYEDKAFAALSEIHIPDERKKHLNAYAEMLSKRSK